MKVTSIDCRRLRRLIRKDRGSRGGGAGGGGAGGGGAGGLLLVDCRPQPSFRCSYVRGSVNVHLNPLLVRRSRSRGPVPPRLVVPDERALRRLREGRVSAVVALDERTPHWRQLRVDSVARAVVESLSGVARGARICFLKGGYENFHSLYPELCTGVKSSSIMESSGSESEKRVISSGSSGGSSSSSSSSGSNSSSSSSSSSCCQAEAFCRHKPDYDQGKPVEILPFLYLGSAYHASRDDYLSDLDISALLNVSRRDLQPVQGHYHYKWIPVEDSHMADISSHFQEAIHFIDQVKQSGGKVLVHCEAGISRSPTICMAYIMRTQRLRLEAAFDIVKQRRRVISPNFSFMNQLQQFESEVLSTAPAHAVTPQLVATRAPESASFFASDFTSTSYGSKNFEPAVFSLPTSCLQAPLHHQLTLSPITALP